MRGAAAADGGERRDPSEKQEPHTVMWGKIHGIVVTQVFRLRGQVVQHVVPTFSTQMIMMMTMMIQD